MFLTTILNKYSPLWAPEGAGAGGGAEGAGADGAGDPPAADAGSVLYPDDPPAGEGEDEDGAGEGDDEGEGASEWKEYEPDPAKSDEENAAAKAEHDKTKPGADDGEEDDPADKVPEDGKYDLKMPEGMEVDQELLEQFSPEFKELGLTNKQAQQLADKFIAREQAKAANWAKEVSGWADKAMADAEIGGAKWDDTVKTASGVVNRFGTPELKQYLNSSGGGNHPEMIRFMAKVGAVIGEDDPAISESPGKGAEKDTASILYPDDKPKGK